MKSIATFDIKYEQFLDHHGKPISERMPPLAKDFEELVKLYKVMTLTRLFDSKAIALQRTGKLGTYASSLGHEAVHVGLGSALKDEDVFAPMYREYGALFSRGVRMSDVLSYWGGDERGSDWSGPKHDFPISVPIGTQCLHAVGSALAFQLRGEPRCAVSIVGDGGSSKGDFLEALNATGAWKLPAVFVIANNQYAISVPRDKQSGAKTLAQKGVAAGLMSIQVDGNDILAVRWAMDTALNQARAGNGGAVIECMTYRLSDHTTADDARRYRPDDEVSQAQAREPLGRLRRYLTANKAWDDDQEHELLDNGTALIESEVQHYLSREPQPVEAMFDHMFANLPHHLQQQRRDALAHAAAASQAPRAADAPNEDVQHG